MSGSVNEEMIGPKGGIKKSEYVRIITAALICLGYNEVADQLQITSGIPLHNLIVSQFLRQLRDGEWDNCITTLERSQLCDEKTLNSASFLLLEQKFLDVLKEGNVTDALSTLKETMMPLGVNKKRVHELASKLIVGFKEDKVSLNSCFEVLYKLHKYLPDGVIVPPRRLECILEQHLDNDQSRCMLHNILDMSLCASHRCWNHKVHSKTVQVLEEHTDQVLFLEFSNNGKYLASSSKDKSAIIWEMGAEGKFLQKHRLVGHEKAVVTVLWSPDDQQVITCGDNEIIRRWNVDSGECIQVYEIDGVRSVSCGWLHEGSGILSAMTDRSIVLWNLDGTVLQKVLDNREQMISDVAITNDGKWIISVKKENKISFSNRVLKRATRFTEADMITSFSLSKDNKYLLINLINEKIHLWHLEGRIHKEKEFSGHSRSHFITKSCFGGYDNTFIASGSEDSQIYIWHRNLPSEPCLVLQGHSGAVNCVSWNLTDLHMFASASDDGTIRIWRLEKE